ncbi:MAG: 1-deoxy-D-xylulose-5-phosphate synthase [Nitrospirae bacterium]|nr:1-deoxy-D-xylulose-5-phosphate synthase [Nitrospirota bacterium]
MKRLLEAYRDDRDLFVLTADLGFKLFDGFEAESRERFYNVGVAEANMIGIAAGLSLCGKNVYCYSIIPFLVMRPFEQVRVDIAYHGLNVKLVGVGGGFTYGCEGFTHFALEDLALMCSLPNMTVVVPADRFEAESVAAISLQHDGPMYIRLGGRGGPVIHDKPPDLKIGRPMVLREGRDIALFATGDMVHSGMRVAGMLSEQGIGTTVVNMHTLKPFDAEFVSGVASAHRAVFSMEEHNVRGGLGSAVAEVLAESGFSGVFRRFGIREEVLRGVVGGADFLRERSGLTPQRLYEEISVSMAEA